MSSSELNERNYLRICFINWAISLPLLLIFAWPYFFLCDLFAIPRWIAFAGSIFFALPFMLTLLHGHVTMALGAVHRDYYYYWLESNPFTYGLLFHPLLVRTRFRLSLFAISIIVLLTGFLITR